MMTLCVSPRGIRLFSVLRHYAHVFFIFLRSGIAHLPFWFICCFRITGQRFSLNFDPSTAAQRTDVKMTANEDAAPKVLLQPTASRNFESAATGED